MGPTEAGTTSPALLNRLVDWRDDEAWHEFVRRYGPLIQVWCARMRLDAETTDELCQRIWINLAHRMSSFQYDPSKKFRGWLRRLFHSRAVDLLRERQAHPVYSPKDTAGASLRFAHAIDADEDRVAGSRRPALLRLGKQVHDSVKSQVEPRTWKAFWSISVDGLSIRETANVLKISYAAAFAAHKRVVQRLRTEGSRMLLERMKSEIGVRSVDQP